MEHTEPIPGTEEVESAQKLEIMDTLLRSSIPSEPDTRVCCGQCGIPDMHGVEHVCDPVGLEKKECYEWEKGLISKIQTEIEANGYKLEDIPYGMMGVVFNFIRSDRNQTLEQTAVLLNIKRIDSNVSTDESDDLKEAIRHYERGIKDGMETAQEVIRGLKK